MEAEQKGKIVVINKEKESPERCPTVNMRYSKNCPEKKIEDFGEKVKAYAPKVVTKIYDVLKSL